MPSITQALLFAATASYALAMTVTSPTKFQLWDSSKSNTITWSSVSSDPKTVDIYLAHMAAHPPLYSLLFSDVSTSDGKVTVSGLQLPNGEAYQINLVAADNENQILAQSQQFNVTGEAVAGATKTLDGYTGPTYTATASGTATGSATKSASLTKVTSTRTGSSTTETTTSTATSDDAESTESSSATSTPSQTIKANASGTSLPTVSKSGSAAAGNFVASGSLFGLVMGVAALLF